MGSGKGDIVRVRRASSRLSVNRFVSGLNGFVKFVILKTVAHPTSLPEQLSFRKLKIECATEAQILPQANGPMHCPGLLCSRKSEKNLDELESYLALSPEFVPDRLDSVLLY